MGAQKKIFWGILLAAGESSRMNSWKPAIELNGKALIMHPVDLLLTVCDKVIIVGGYNYNILVELFNDKQIYNERCEIVINKNYSLGMLSSVQAGLPQLPVELNGVFILPADMPFVKNTTVTSLIKSFEENDSKDVFIPVTILENGRLKKGHPVIIRSTVITDIKNYDNTKTLRDALKSFNIHLCEVDDKGILFDIDEQKDLENAIKFNY